MRRHMVPYIWCHPRGAIIMLLLDILLPAGESTRNTYYSSGIRTVLPWNHMAPRIVRNMGPHGARWRFGIRRIAKPATFVRKIASTQTVCAIWRAMFGPLDWVHCNQISFPIPFPTECFIHLCLVATLGPPKLTVEQANEVIHQGVAFSHSTSLSWDYL